jgi:phage tail sheath gpL-like
MSSVPFNHISSGLVAPIFTVEVNSAGTFEAESRIVLFGHKQTSGSLAEATPTFAASQEAVDAFCGPNSMLRDMYRVTRAQAPAEPIWLVVVPATGTAATWTVTMTTPPTEGGYGVLSVAGRSVELTIAAGSTAANAAADLADAINDYYDPLTRATLPVTATVSGAVVTLTAVHAGLVAGDIEIRVDTSDADNAYIDIATVAAGTAAAGTADTSAALAALADDEATTVLSPFGDATNLGRYRTWGNDASGRWSWSRQSYGHVWTVATDAAADLVTTGEALSDDRHTTVLGRIESSGDAHPPWVWLCDYAAGQVVWLHDGATGNVSRSMSGVALQTVTPPRDRSKWPSYETRNQLLRSRISTWRVENGTVVVDKAVTAMKRNTLGQIDTTFRDVQALYQLTFALKFFRERLAAEHGQKAVADENPAGVAAISTPADIRATMVHSYQALVSRGVLEDADGFATKIVVERNADSANRVDVLAPLDRTNPLDVIAANALLYSQF